MTSHHSIAVAFLVVHSLVAIQALAEPPRTSVKTRVVSVEGSGLTEQDALKSACTRAVESVVGLLVDSKTAVDNDEIISDRILTFSNGYIEKYDIVFRLSRNWTNANFELF